MRVIELPAVIKSGESLAFIFSGSKSELIAVAARASRRPAEFQLYILAVLRARAQMPGRRLAHSLAATPAAAIYHKISRFQSKISRFSLSALLAREIIPALCAMMEPRK